ncbi:class I tRNA ligase family protein, partial [Acidithiobacillus sp.]
VNLASRAAGFIHRSFAGRLAASLGNDQAFYDGLLQTQEAIGDQHLNPEFLRYYVATKLNSHVEDIDLNLEDFLLKGNGDLVGKVVNLASRAAGFIHRSFAGRLAASLGNDQAFYDGLLQTQEAIG